MFNWSAFAFVLLGMALGVLACYLLFVRSDSDDEIDESGYVCSACRRRPAMFKEVGIMSNTVYRYFCAECAPQYTHTPTPRLIHLKTMKGRDNKT